MFGIQPIFWVLIDSAVAFLYLFIISKILGKKQIAQLEFIDYTVGISLGSIAAEMATNTEVPFYFFLIAMTIFFALALLVAIIGRKNTFLKRLLKGKPATLVYDGKINYKELKKNKIDVNDLLSMLREKNYFDIADVAYAVFVMEDVDKSKVEKAELTDVLIVDGAVSYSGLSEINKDVDWLFSRLKIKQKKDLQNIILAVYDDKQDKFNVHYKNQ